MVIQEKRKDGWIRKTQLVNLFKYLLTKILMLHRNSKQKALVWKSTVLGAGTNETGVRWRKPRSLLYEYETTQE